MSTDTALVVIDVQRDLFETPGFVPYEGDAILGRVAGLIAAARQTDTPVVYIQHTALSGDELVKGTPGWQCMPTIAPKPGDIISEKSSYDAFFNTELHDKLTTIGANNLIFCGLQTEFCVDTTVRSALAHGYKSTIIADAHTTFDTEIIPAKTIIAHHNRTWDGRFGTVITSKNAPF